MTEFVMREIEDERINLKYPLQETKFHQMVVTILKVLFKGVMKLKISGLENLPEHGPVILVANHVTNLDIFPLQIAITRPIFFMGKAELFKNRLVHVIFRNLGAFPVFRGERDEWAIMHSKRVLETGQVLGIFPEGTRSRGRGLKVAKTGAARLSIELNCPIIPVGIIGSHTFFKQFPRRNEMEINVGRQIVPDPNELPIALTDRMMYHLAMLLPSELRGVYGVDQDLNK